MTLGILRAAACCAVLALTATLRAETVERPVQASTSKAARIDAERAIPLAKLDEADREKVAGVLANVSLFRRLPPQVVPCDPELQDFLLRHPDVLVNLWEVLGISRARLDKVGDGKYQIDDRAGTKGTVEILYRNHDTHLIYAEGTYTGSLFTRQVHGRTLLLLRTAAIRETDGKYYVTSRLDSFVTIDHFGVELLAKTFSTMVGKTADVNFAETTGFVATLTRHAEVNPARVQRWSEKLSRCDEESRDKFRELIDAVHERGVMLEESRRVEAAPVARRTEKPAAVPAAQRK